MKILIADDDSFIRNFYSSKLKELGHVTEVAEDGTVAMEKIRTFSPDILLLDIIMPKKDGFAVMREMKADPVLAKIPIVVFSTLGQEEDVSKGLKLGANDYVNKSFYDFPNMLEKINKFVKP